MILTGKKRFIAIGLIWAYCFVILAVMYIFVISPQNENIALLKKTLATKKHDYDKAVWAGQSKTKQRLQTELDNLRSRYKMFIIDYKDSVNLLFDINQLAQAKSINAISIKTQDDQSTVVPQDCKFISANRIKVSFDATFVQFGKFLNDLERHRPIVFIDSFSMTRSSENKALSHVEMELSFFVNFVKNDKVAMNARNL